MQPYIPPTLGSRRRVPERAVGRGTGTIHSRWREIQPATRPVQVHLELLPLHALRHSSLSIGVRGTGDGPSEPAASGRPRTSRFQACCSLTGASFCSRCLAFRLMGQRTTPEITRYLPTTAAESTSAGRLYPPRTVTSAPVKAVSIILDDPGACSPGLATCPSRHRGKSARPGTALDDKAIESRVRACCC